MLNIAVLVSGGGTNLQALLDSEARGENPNGKITLVVASKPGVYALERAAKAGVEGVVDNLRSLLGRVRVFGICLGHQMLGLAYGATTYKLKFGHRGGNQPVKDLRTGRVEITAQNHGFCVDPATLPPSVEVTHINLNDGSLEGMRHREWPAFSVQYHPEASPGPTDAHYLFTAFTRLMDGEENYLDIDTAKDRLAGWNFADGGSAVLPNGGPVDAANAPKRQSAFQSSLAYQSTRRSSFRSISGTWKTRSKWT